MPARAEAGTRREPARFLLAADFIKLPCHEGGGRTFLFIDLYFRLVCLKRGATEPRAIPLFRRNAVALARLYDRHLIFTTLLSL